jgi:hypothetical protein
MTHVGSGGSVLPVGRGSERPTLGKASKDKSLVALWRPPFVRSTPPPRIGAPPRNSGDASPSDPPRDPSAVFFLTRR